MLKENYFLKLVTIMNSEKFSFVPLKFIKVHRVDWTPNEQNLISN